MKFDKFVMLKLDDGRPFCVGYIKEDNIIVAELRETLFDDYSDRIANGSRYLAEHKDMIVDIVKRFEINGAEGFYIAGDYI